MSEPEISQTAHLIVAILYTMVAVGLFAVVVGIFTKTWVSVVGVVIMAILLFCSCSCGLPHCGRQSFE